MRLLFALTLSLLFVLACGGGDSADPTATSTASPQFTGCPKFAPLSPNTHTIRIAKATGTTATVIVQLADTAAERATGLMDRDCLPEDSGMLFAFPEDTSTPFYMKDTLIPLTIAFIQADGTIVHIEDMQPNTTDNHVSPEPYRYAIEVSQGWFAANGVAVGDVAGIDEMFSANASN